MQVKLGSNVHKYSLLSDGIGSKEEQTLPLCTRIFLNGVLNGGLNNLVLRGEHIIG